MDKTAFLFPGQGSQFAGMGKALAAQYASARRVFEEADQALGFALSQLCFEGPEEELKLTENTQPAMVTISITWRDVSTCGIGRSPGLLSLKARSLANPR